MIHIVTRQKRLEDSQLTYHYTLDRLLDYFKDKSVIAVDTETTGLYPDTDRLLLIQLGDRDNQWVVDATTIDVAPLQPILENQKKLKILHNAKFDYKFLKAAGLELEQVWDTELAERVLHCGYTKPKGFHGLSQTLKRYLNVDMSKAEQIGFTRFQGTFTLSQLIYAAEDVKYLNEVRLMQKEALAKKKLEKTVQLENKAVLALGDMEFNGIMLDKKAWIAQAKEAEARLVERESLLYQSFYDHPLFIDKKPRRFQLSLFGTAEEDEKKAFEDGLNFNSPKQMLPLFRRLIPEIESTDSKVLEKYKLKHPLIKQYLDYKETKKQASTYGEDFLKYVRPDGHVRSQIRQIVSTGRMSSSEPNMQNLPADNLYRNCFTAPEGWVYVSSDFSSQELCVVAEGAKEDVWIDALKCGQDLHSVCAELVYGQLWKDYAEESCAYYNQNQQKCSCKQHKVLRQNVKSVNFGLCYGAGPSKLSEQLNISLDEAKDLVDIYFKAFPSIKRFLDNLARFGKSHGYIRTFAPFNRIRHFDGWHEGLDDRKVLGEIDRQSRNQPIQGKQKLPWLNLVNSVKAVMLIPSQA